MLQHTREDRENNVQTMAISLFRGPRDYNVLKLTGQDIAFLKTRGIAVDDKIQYDPCIEDRPVSDSLAEKELSRSAWAKILNRVWSRRSDDKTVK